ncbi:hypothetical protein FXF51_32455 [Nonomuraea sp. PA05]|nr:hypothetical protein FXF51_32455 [Nonomuraea sp. PA05]
MEVLTTAWRTRWDRSPIAYQLRGWYADRWVRFHSLPGSKRYADTDDEYQLILERHHRVLDEFGTQEGLYVIAAYFEDEEGTVSPDPRHLGAVPWLTIAPGDESSLAATSKLYASRASFDQPALDPLLRGVADGEIFDVIIAPLDLRWLYHPYDGGADVIAPTAHDRDVLKHRYSDWLSTHPAGL